MAIRLPSNRSTGNTTDDRGQSMVEFSMMLPIFLMIVIGLIEFSFAFNALLSVNFASRDAALLAAEAASDSGSDCIVLASIESDVMAPSSRSRINEVRVFWATDTGAVMPGNPVNLYRRTGSTTCALSDGTTVVVPYSLVGAPGYPETSRCDVLAGCGGGHDTVDTIGVQITYTHTFVTPIANFIAMNGGGWSFTHTTAMRMEPSL